ncbi:ABC transporter permease [Leeia aquatica]|uniref:ABC transporter permease n=1 Tax=Leeia aquatica TaxID=2725557 RepID=A0A847SDV2_9NEIS|nr:ABC transporter permease [Leeia aquatica]NLR75616.1 ABC transporter permease [Leeia aquatica]
MTSTSTMASTEQPALQTSPSPWRLSWRRFKRDRVGMVCLFIIGAYLLVAALSGLRLIGGDWREEVGKPYAPPTLFKDAGPQAKLLTAADIAAAQKEASGTVGLSAAEDPLAADMASLEKDAAKYRNTEPVIVQQDTLPFGGDLRGRDVGRKVLSGSTVSLLVGVSGALLAVLIGAVMGGVSGYFGGWLDDVLNWFYNVFTSIPDMLLLLAFAAVSGRGISTVIMVMALTSWTSPFRLARAEFMKHKGREYVRAADALGAGHLRRMVRHILPNMSHVLLVQFSILTVGLIKYEAVLSFLGFGVGVNQVSWGSMLAEAPAELIQGYWWQILTVTVVMSLFVTAFSLLTDSMRDALDPKQK